MPKTFVVRPLWSEFPGPNVHHNNLELAASGRRPQSTVHATHVVGAWLILIHSSVVKFGMLIFLEVNEDGLFFKNIFL